MRIAIVSILRDGQDGPALRELARVASPVRHELVENPDDADLVVLTDLDPARDFESVRRHELVRKAFRKLVTVYHWHEPYGLLPGIYTETPEGAWRWSDSFYRAGLYWPAHHTNTIVREQGAALARQNAFRDPCEARKYLFSFMGRNSHPARAAIMRLPAERDDLRAHLELTDSYDHWRQDGSAEKAQQHYVEIALESDFALCPRGLRKPSIRLFEMMQLGVCPVVIADGYRFPDGPDWEKFCLVVKERDIGRLWEILLAHRDEADERGRLARAAWDKWFLPELQFNYIVDRLSEIQSVRHENDSEDLRVYWTLRIATVKAHQKWRGLRRRLGAKKRAS